LPFIDKHPASRLPNSFFTALSHALLLDKFSVALTQRERHAAAALNIRDYTMAYLKTNASSHFDLFDGIPVRDFMRQMYITAPVCAKLHTTSLLNPISGLASVSSWRDYIDKMLLVTTANDCIVVRAAALLFRTQIVLVKPDAHCFINPDDGVRRVFMYVHQDEAFDTYSWMHHSEDDKPRLPPSTHMHFDRDCLIECQPDSLRFLSQPPADHPRPRPSVTQPIYSQLLHAFHCGFTGHPGIDATRTALRAAGHHWRGMTRDIRCFIRSCPTCAVTLVHHAAARASAIPNLRGTDKPLSRLHLDHVSFTTCAMTGFTAACVLVCEVTGFTFLAGSRRKSALEVALALIAFSSFYQMPDELHTDGGPEFDNAILKELFNLTGLKTSLSIPQAPHSNGIAERNVQLTSRFLRSMCIDFGRNSAWGLFLPMVMKAINHLPRRSLSGGCPQSFIFSSLNDDDDANVFPIVPCPLPIDEPSSFDKLSLPSSFARRAIYAQQVLSNAVCEHRDRLLQAAIRKDVKKPPPAIRRRRTSTH
jgi:hypothetical protein